MSSDCDSLFRSLTSLHVQSANHKMLAIDLDGRLPAHDHLSRSFRAKRDRLRFRSASAENEFLVPPASVRQNDRIAGLQVPGDLHELRRRRNSMFRRKSEWRECEGGEDKSHRLTKAG